MADFNISRLNKIVKNTISMIDKSREAIYDIAEGARKECDRLQKELDELKFEVQEIVIGSDKLEAKLKNSRKKLSVISKNFERFTQEDIRIAYDNADRVRIELAINRERERFAILRRNDLERRLKDAFSTVDKAELLVNQVGTVMNYLSGDLNDLNVQLEDVEKRKFLAIRIIKAQEEERKRLARDIHDGPAQMMSNIVLKAEICEKLIDVNIDKAKVELKNLKNIVRDSMMDVRRIIYDLRPMSLEDLGLIPTLQKHIEKFSSESGIDIKFQKIGADKVHDDRNLNLTVFRVVQEALNNIRKHSCAKVGSVRIEFTPLGIVLKISDIGKGFNINDIKVDKDDNRGGFGLFSMKERIELLDGTMEIESKIGKGTNISVILPYTKS